MNYDKIIKKLREENKLSQSEIATMLEIDRTTYTHYENNNFTIPLKYLNTLANYYNVSIDYLFTLTQNRNYSCTLNQIDSKKTATRLKEFRKEIKFTQYKLALELNTNQSVIANYERGRTIIATPFLYTICKKYNISADYLLGKIDSPKYL